MNKNKICIIGVYFGQLPTYFDLWLKSCEYNNSIDFLIFTDNNLSKEKLPENVKLVKIELAYIQKQMSNILGFSTSINSAYKCCDCKPLYGSIFRNYLTGYEYWGHCDIDLIWGDLNFYITNYDLYKYDKFLSLGHLSLYRNTSENNQRYLLDGSECGDYKKIFSNENNIGFDEEKGIVAIFEKNNIPMFTKRVYADISPSYKRFRCARKDKNYSYQVFFWRDGKTYRAYSDENIIKEEEFMYVHFQKRGNLNSYNISTTNRGFFITNTGFYPMEKDEVTIEDIKKYNPFISNTYEKIEKVFRRIINGIMREKRNIQK